MVVRGTFSKGFAISALVMHMHCSMSTFDNGAVRWTMKDNFHLKSNVAYSSVGLPQAYLEKGDDHGQ
jgi:hypothetical protein